MNRSYRSYNTISPTQDVGIEPVWRIWLNKSNKIGAMSCIVVLKNSAGIPSIPALLPTGSGEIDRMTSSRVNGSLSKSADSSACSWSLPNAGFNKLALI